MKRGIRSRIILLGAVLAVVALARESEFCEFRAVQESLSAPAHVKLFVLDGEPRPATMS